MIFAAIDIGSNAARLLFANVFSQKNKIYVEKATMVRIPTRLGEDVFSINRISEDRADKLIKTLNAFKLLIEVYNPVAYVAVATAAMREAENGDEIIQRVQKETGFEVTTIDGIEEANIIRQTNKKGFEHPHDISMYIDVGGGSTDISILNNDKLLGVKSFKIGTLRILSKKVNKKEWDDLESWLNTYSRHFGKINVVGSGGNINKIHKLYGDPASGILSYNNLKKANKYLKSYSIKERIDKLGFRPDRADVILPASKIFIFIMKIIQADTIIVPKIGLADGLVYKLFEKYTENTKQKSGIKA
ncbi:MAG: Ppx/GppA family phosphatase [Bacteroidales bacterium]|nr:Ppx/GppA family phosphatase [Bacteroidales bacterium]